MALPKNILEQKQRFSKSLLWTMQQEAYQNFGIQAWTEKGVPFYLTSNPLTAKKYAKIVLGYIRDGLNSQAAHPLDMNHPIYIFDLGAGTGRFGYLFLQFLKTELSELFHGKVKIRYVMTDIAEKNIDFWLSHSYLAPFFKEGMLDAAVFRHDQADPIFLRHSQEILTPENLVNPIVLIANYFFDTIPQDLFRIEHGVLQEGLVTIKRQENDQARAGSDILKGLTFQYDYQPVGNISDYYPESPILNRLLVEYQQKFQNATFLYPIGAFQALRFFEGLSKDRFLLLAGDQGVVTDDQIREWGEPKIDLHGTFSISVCYDLIARYLDDRGGLGFLTQDPDPLFVVMCGVLDGRIYPETSFSFFEEFDSFEPKDYWNICEGIENESSASIDHLLALLKLGAWDPMNFYAIYPKLQQLALGATDRQKNRLANAIRWTEDAFYPVSPQEGDFILNLGALLISIGKYREAIPYFQKSLSIGGNETMNLMNMAICYKALNMTVLNHDL